MRPINKKGKKVIQKQHVVLFLALIVLVSSASYLRAQATHAILPPSSQVQFASAEIDDDGKLVVITSTKAILRVNGKGEVIEDDNPPARRPRFVQQQVTMEYSVEVPYFEVVEKDGKNIRVMKTRSEQRTRTVVKCRVMGEMKGYKVGLKPLRMSYDLDKTTFFDLEQNRIDAELVRKRLRERKPVIVADAKEDIPTDFYKFALNKDIMIVVLNPARPDNRD